MSASTKAQLRTLSKVPKDLRAPPAGGRIKLRYVFSSFFRLSLLKYFESKRLPDCGVFIFSFVPLVGSHLSIRTCEFSSSRSLKRHKDLAAIWKRARRLPASERPGRSPCFRPGRKTTRQFPSPVPACGALEDSPKASCTLWGRR